MGSNVTFFSTGGGRTLTIDNTTFTSNVSIINSNVTISGRGDGSDRNTPLLLATGNSGVINNSILIVNFGSNTNAGIGGTLTNNAGAANLVFQNGARYLHQRDGGNLPVATFDNASLSSVTGIISNQPTLLDGSVFSDFYWDCAGQNSTSGIIGVNAQVKFINFVVNNTNGQVVGFARQNNATYNVMADNISILGGNFRTHGYSSTNNRTLNLTLTGSLYAAPGTQAIFSDADNSNNRNTNLFITGNDNSTIILNHDITNTGLNITLTKNSDLNTAFINRNSYIMGSFNIANGIFDLENTSKNITVTGTLSGSGTLNASGAPHLVNIGGGNNDIATILAGSSSTFNYYQGSQTIPGANYHHLILNTSGNDQVKTWNTATHHTISGVVSLTGSGNGSCRWEIAGNHSLLFKSDVYGVFPRIEQISPAKLFFEKDVHIESTANSNYGINPDATIAGILFIKANNRNVPNFTWLDGSTCSVAGVVSNSTVFSNNNSFYNFVWNSTGQTANNILHNAAGVFDFSVRNNFMVASTGTTGTFDFLSNGAGVVNAVINNFSITGGTIRVRNNNNPTLNLSVTGNFFIADGASFTRGGGSPTTNISFLGNTAPYLSNSSLPDLVNITLQKNGINQVLSLNSDLLANVNSITFTQGKIQTYGYVASITSTRALATNASQTAGWVQGNLARNFPIGTLSRTFFIGGANNYTPITLQLNASAAGSIMASVTGSVHPNIAASCFDPTKTIARTWSVKTLTGSTLSANYTRIEVTFASVDTYAGFNVNNVFPGLYVNGAWQYPTTVLNRVGNSITFAGIASGILEADVVLGEPAIVGAMGTISGSSVVCQGTTSAIYSIPTITGITNYTWSVPAAYTIVSGQGTPTLTLSVNTTTLAGVISVIGTNGCGAVTDRATHNITIQPSVTGISAITGNQLFSCMPVVTTTSYNVSATNAGQYVWNIAGGIHTFTGVVTTTSNAITWNPSFSDIATITARAIGQLGCGTVTAPNFSVTINPNFGNTIAGDQIACNGNTIINNLTGSVPVVPGFSYLWEFSTSSVSGFTTVPGAATAQNYNANVITMGGSDLYFRRNVQVGACVQASNIVKVTSLTPDVTEPNVYPNGYWAAYAYYGSNYPADKYAGKWTFTGFSFSLEGAMGGVGNSPSFVAGYDGCRIANDYFSVRYRTQGLVTATGQYLISMTNNNDDNAYAIIAGVDAGMGAIPNNQGFYYIGNLSPSDAIDIGINEDEDSARLNISIVPTVPGTLNGGTVSIPGLGYTQTICPLNAIVNPVNETRPSGGCHYFRNAANQYYLTNVYQWQRSFDGVNWTNIGGPTLNYTGTMEAVDVQTFYRRRVTDLCGNQAYSNVLTVNIGYPTGNPTVAGVGRWNGYYYNDQFLSTYVGNFTFGGLSVHSNSIIGAIAGGPDNIPDRDGCNIGKTDNWSLRMVRTGLTPGYYEIGMIDVNPSNTRPVRADDRFRFYINNQLITTKVASSPVGTFFTGKLSASDVLTLEFEEGTANAEFHLTIVGPNVTPPLTSTSAIVGENAIICGGEIPGQILRELAPFSSTCSLKTSQWQMSTVSGSSGFTNIAGANSLNLDINFTVNHSTWFRRLDVDFCGQTVPSNVILYTITGTIPGDTSVFGNNQWLVYGFLNNNYTNYRGFVAVSTTAGLGFNSSNYFVNTQNTSNWMGYQGCALQSAPSSNIAKRMGLTPGKYEISVRHDNGAQVWVNGVRVYNQNTVANTLGTTGWIGDLGATDKVEFRHFQNFGNAYFQIEFTPITASGVTSAGSISGSNVVCYSTTGQTFSNVAVGTTAGCYIYYRWEMSNTPSFVAITSLTGLTNQSSFTNALIPVTTTSYIRRAAVDACGNVLYSNTVVLSVLGPLNAGSINSIASVCNNQNPGTITSATLPTGGLGTYTYVWQSSPNNVTWTNITTATGITYFVNTLTSPVYFRRSETSGSCGTVFTNSILVENLLNTTITSQLFNQTVCGTTAQFSVGATGSSVTYQWQASTASGTYFTIPNGFTYNLITVNGVLNPTISVTGVNELASGIMFRSIVTGACGNPLTSTGASLNTGTPAIVVQPQSQAICNGGTAIFAPQISSLGDVYIWSVSTDRGSTYSTLTDNSTVLGSNTPVLTVTNLSTLQNSHRYRLTIDLTCATLTSNISAGVLTVFPAISPNTINTVYGSPYASVNTVCANTNFTMAAPASTSGGGGGGYTYSWWRSDVSSTTGFTTVAGTGSNSGNQNINAPAWFYRLTRSGFGCEERSPIVYAVPQQQTSVAAITPNLTQCQGTTFVFNVTAAGTGPFSYQWQRNISGWQNLVDDSEFSGVNTPSLSILGIANSLSGVNYRVNVSGTCGNANSGNRDITYQFPLTIVSQPVDRSACIGNSGTFFSISVVGDIATRQWQRSLDGGSSWENATGTYPHSGAATTGPDLNFANQTSTYYAKYRVALIGACSPLEYSHIVNLSVNPAIANNFITNSSPINVCNASTTTLIGSNPSGGTSSYTYTWQTSLNNIVWNNITGSNTINYIPDPVTVSTYFRRTVASGTCAVVSSTGVQFTLLPGTAIATQPTNQGICRNTNAAFSVSAVGVNLVYSWQISTNSGVSWMAITPSTNISGQIANNTYSPTSRFLTINNVPANFNGLQYRAVVAGDCGAPITSTGANLNVTDTPLFASNPTTDLTIFDGQPAIFVVVATSTSAISYQWGNSSALSGPYTALSNTPPYSGVTTTALTLTGALTSLSGTYYRPVAFIDFCSVTGTGRRLIVNANLWLGNNTNWFDPINWGSGTVPNATTNVLISTGASNYPVLNANGAVVANISVAGSLNLSNYALSITGNFNNTGTISGSSAGKMVFNGVATQQINGNPFTVPNIDVAENVKVRLNTSVSVTNTLQLFNDAHLTTTGNNLVLKSNSVTGTARIMTLPASAQITGNITMERYVAAKNANRFISSPLQNGNLTMLGQNIWLIGFGASFDVVTSNFSPTIFWYVETVAGGINSGYRTPSTKNMPFEVGRGYMAFLRGDKSRDINSSNAPTAPTTDITLSFTGVINSGTIHLPVTYTNHGVSSADGWNLVGNPYPCEIDWNSAAGWTKTNINPTIAVWDPGTYLTNGINTTATGSYYYYDEGAGCPPSRPVNCSIIASTQGFFIRATTAPGLTINENAKLNTGNNHVGYFRRDYTLPQNALWMRLTAKGNSSILDESAIVFRNNASDSYEKTLDAVKMPNPQLNFGTLSADSVTLAINYHSVPLAKSLIPLVINTTHTGEYELSFYHLNTFGENFAWSVWDSKNDIAYPVSEKSIVNVSVGVNNKNRYYLVIEKYDTFIGNAVADNTKTSEGVLQTQGNGDITDIQVINTSLTEANDHSVTIYPNPAVATDVVQISINGWAGSHATLRVFDMNGKAVLKTKAVLNKGNGKAAFEATKLPIGLYAIRVENDKYFKVIKWSKH